MNPGDVVLIPLPQLGGGAAKLRPALLLTLLRGPYQNVLLCGISTQLHLIQANWDELIQPGMETSPAAVCIRHP
jgi:mRNA interferase MazF